MRLPKIPRGVFGVGRLKMKKKARGVFGVGRLKKRKIARKKCVWSGSLEKIKDRHRLRYVPYKITLRMSS